MMKNCTNCGVEHTLEAFGKDKRRPLGLNRNCRESINSARRRRFSEDPVFAEKIRQCNKEQYAADPSKTIARTEKLKAKYPERYKKYVEDYRARNPEKHKARLQKWERENRAYLAKKRRERRANDINFRLRDNLRCRIRSAIFRGKKGSKAGSAVADLGCSIPEFIGFIETGFTPDMSWENYGSYWEMDHIQPLAGFDLTDREQFLVACNYTNLQPLSIEKHKEKTAKEARRA